MTTHVQISPSILAADLACLGDEVDRAERGGCDDFHIDIMDGHFVPNLSYGPYVTATMRRLTERPLDVHLMVDNPLDLAPAFVEAGADLLTFHSEVTEDIPGTAAAFRELGVKPGISLKPDTPVEDILPHLHLFEIVLVMSVYPGFGGQTFIEDAYRRISAITDEARRIGHELLISVDGGVGPQNARQLADAGANHLVAGTAVFRDHGAVENIAALRTVLDT